MGFIYRTGVGVQVLSLGATHAGNKRCTGLGIYDQAGGLEALGLIRGSNQLIYAQALPGLWFSVVGTIFPGLKLTLIGQNHAGHGHHQYDQAGADACTEVHPEECFADHRGSQVASPTGSVKLENLHWRK